MGNFNEATAATPVSAGHYTGQIPDLWQQGRGAFGGLVVGLLFRAAEHHLANTAWPLRALNAEIFAPVVVGAAQVTVETMRAGSGMSTLLARLTQDGEPRARATAIFGKSRVEDRELVTLSPPSLPAHAEMLAMPPDGPAPVFTNQLEYRPADPLPYSGAKVPGAAGWIQFRQQPAPLRMHDLIGLIDAWWPATFAIEPAPRPMATVSFTFEPLVDPASLDPEKPFRYRCTVPASHGGFAVELRELWSHDGKLVALNQQSFVTIK